MSPALCLIDHPEARASLEHLGRARGVRAEHVYAPVGRTLGQAPPRSLPSRPFVVVNGSGNFHHETALLVESLLAARGPEAEPLSYLQIDAHPDIQAPFRWQASCASFVSRLVENPGIASIHLLGQHLPCLLEPDYPMPCFDRLDHIRADFFGRVHQYQVAESGLEYAYFPFSPEALAAAKRNPAVRRAAKRKLPPRPHREGPALTVRWRTLDELDLAAMPPRPAYLSIDLDVARARPVTDWRRGDDPARFTGNQGAMEWSTLLELIRDIGRSLRVIGSDFCGLTEGLERLDAEERADSLEAIVEVYDALADALSAG